MLPKQQALSTTSSVARSTAGDGAQEVLADIQRDGGHGGQDGALAQHGGVDADEQVLGREADARIVERGDKDRCGEVDDGQ